MKNMTTLGEVADRVDAISKNCHDRVVNVSDIAFMDLENVSIAGETFPVKTVAQRSFAYRLGIPYQYLSRCPAEIQAMNMNHWIKEEPNDELFFRFDGNQVRALFTTKYQPVDNFEVVERLDAFGFGPDTPVQCNLDDEFMSISIPDKDYSFKVNNRDEHIPGISISSWPGLIIHRRFYFAPYLHQWRCKTNQYFRKIIPSRIRQSPGRIAAEH